MTMNDAPLFNDADLRVYLTARADAVARRAAPADDMAVRVAVELGLVRRRLTGRARVLRLALIAALIAALAAGAIFVAGLLREDDYAPAQPEVTINVHGSPWGVAAFGGSIWTGGYLEPVIFEIEPASGKIVDEIPIGKRICGEIASAFGYLWFTTCPDNPFLGRLDPLTGHIDRLNGYGGDRIGFGGGRVWMVHDGALEGLDPDTLATVDRIPEERLGVIAYAFGDVWISDADGDVVARVDLEAGQIVAEVTWPAAEGRDPVHLVEADGAMWVVDELGLAVYRIDPATNEASRVGIALEFIDGTGWGDHPIAFGGGELWVRESETSLARIDTASLTVAERVTTEAFGGGAFVVIDNALWYTNLKGTTLIGLQRP